MQYRLVLLLGQAGILVVNVGGIIIYSGVGIEPGIKLLSLNDKSKASSRNRLSEVKILIVDELSMVLRDLWKTHIFTIF